MSSEQPTFPTTPDGEPDWDTALEDLGMAGDRRPLFRIGNVVFRVHYRVGSKLRVQRMYAVAEESEDLDIKDLWLDHVWKGLTIERVTPEYLAADETVAVPSRVELTEDTVRIRDDAGEELVTWTADEWVENPREVVPAILEAVTTAPVDITELTETLGRAADA